MVVNIDYPLERLRKGTAYNLNTKLITITDTTALMYLKNTGTENIIIDAVAIGIGNASGGFSDNADIIFMRNPTTGTIFDATPDDVPININRNFGSIKTLDCDCYKGTDLDTFTNGDEGLFVAQNGQGRSFITIDCLLQTNNSIGIKVAPNLNSGNVTIYIALIAYTENQLKQN